MQEKKFATLVRERVMTADEVRESIGLQSRQGVWDRVAAGTLPAPILKKPRGFALWDRKVIEKFTNTEGRA